jgi:hypothetical protein
MARHPSHSHSPQRHRPPCSGRGVLVGAPPPVPPGVRQPAPRRPSTGLVVCHSPLSRLPLTRCCCRHETGRRPARLDCECWPRCVPRYPCRPAAHCRRYLGQPWTTFAVARPGPTRWPPRHAAPGGAASCRPRRPWAMRGMEPGTRPRGRTEARQRRARCGCGERCRSPPPQPARAPTAQRGCCAPMVGGSGGSASAVTHWPRAHRVRLRRAPRRSTAFSHASITHRTALPRGRISSSMHRNRFKNAASNVADAWEAIFRGIPLAHLLTALSCSSCNLQRNKIINGSFKALLHDFARFARDRVVDACCAVSDCQCLRLRCCVSYLCANPFVAQFHACKRRTRIKDGAAERHWRGCCRGGVHGGRRGCQRDDFERRAARGVQRAHHGRTRW